MSKKVRWGILGVAKINNRLLPAFAQANNAELRAIASRDVNKAQEAAKHAGIPVAHGSYEALLDDPTIDAIYNPLPNTLHSEWTKKAADRGKHVLCEKPLAPSAAEAADVVAHCQARGVKLMDGFMWPHHPRTAKLKQLLQNGSVGDVRLVTGAFTFAMQPLSSTNIRLQPALGGGSLLDVGCYPVYGIRWAFGAEPIRVYATATYLHGVDVSMSGILHFADGRVGSFDCGFTLPFRGWLEIAGTTGAICVSDMWLPSAKALVEIHRDDQPTVKITHEGANQIVHMLENFGRAVLDNTAISPSPEEAVHTLRVLDALALSARESRIVTL